MPIGLFTGQFDLPLLLVIVFVLFFFALVYYLQQEMKREGYPLVSDRTERTGGRVKVVGYPPMPSPKVFIQPNGRPPVYAPRLDAVEEVDAINAGNMRGLPIEPRGDGMGAGLGPGSWVARNDAPDVDRLGNPMFRPLRHATDFFVAKGEPDPMGFAVLGLDKQVAGTVVDIWVDMTEHMARFLEIDLASHITDMRRTTPLAPRAEREVVGAVVTEEIVDTDIGLVDVVEVDLVTAPIERRAEDARPRPGSVLIPMEFAAVNAANRTVRSGAITARQFAGVPGRKRDLSITAREENELRAYYGGGYLYAIPSRREPLL